ncbi:MAG: DUF202 domain-containing protein [Planctomycetales bacterium]|nr:DUF202 domain-containing protein [Planctomycetales bacterium]
MQGDDPANYQQQLAESRTDLAQQRTLLAEERTYSAWVRTGLAAMATGFAIAKLMLGAGPEWLVRTLGAIFILVAGAMFLFSFWTYRQATRRMPLEISGGMPLWVIASLTLALLLATCISLGLVWLGSG